MDNIIYTAKRFYKLVKNYLLDNWSTRNSKVKLYNAQIYDYTNYSLLKRNKYHEHWMVKFILNGNYNSKKNISIFGLNGDVMTCKLVRSGIKIMFISENVYEKNSPWNKYLKLIIDNTDFDLIIGFSRNQYKNYIRFPFWLTSIFKPIVDKAYIQNELSVIENYNKIIQKRDNFCAFIARVDYFGDRIQFFNEINQIEKVNCPSKFNFNDVDLTEKFNDNKIEYLKNFKFNLCPENSNNKDYVTEKIFESIKAGCIPIYWGSNQCPEPEILNQNRIIFISKDNNNQESIDLIKKLMYNEIEYDRFKKQNVFKHNSEQIIYDYFKELHQKITRIVSNEN